jgi:predicted AlkP superfamily pyrophosphatase or phosphodiesterase
MKMKSLKTVLPLATILLGLSIQPKASAEPLKQSDKIVVMISVDGLAGFYLDDPKAEMPNIRGLAAEGARAESMKASTPTVTWPNHTTLVTGVSPGVHGVVGNNFYDRAARKKQNLIWDPTFDKDEIVKVPTLYDLAKSNGMTTAAIRWPATRNAKSLDWTMPDMKFGPGEKKYTTPVVAEECLKEGISFETESSSEKEHDQACVNVFNSILKKHRPQFALLHLVDVDHTEHAKGPRSPGAYEAIKTADAQVGAVWKELKESFPGKASLVVVSDHGFSPIKRTVLPNVILRKAGLIKENDKNSSIQIVSQAGAAMVYILDDANRKTISKKITKALEGVDEIASIVGSDRLKKEYGVADPKDDPHAPDMIIFAKLGFVFGDTAAGSMSFQDKPERLGSHGHDPALPDLHATFVAWGVGIKPGARVGEIENTQVAPTVAKLLHISMPPSVKSAPVKGVLSE